MYVFLELSVSSNVSHQWVCASDAPLPSGGSRWPRFPAFKGTIRTLRLPAPACPSAHCFRQPAPQAPAGFVSAIGAPAAVQAGRRAGVRIAFAGTPLSSVPARGQEQDLPGSLAVHPVTLRRSTTPDDPLRLARSGASGTAPTRLTMKASSIYRFRGCTPLRHLLSTLHDGRCRTPCKTRFRLAPAPDPLRLRRRPGRGRGRRQALLQERFQAACAVPGLNLPPTQVLAARLRLPGTRTRSRSNSNRQSTGSGDRRGGGPQSAKSATGRVPETSMRISMRGAIARRLSGYRCRSRNDRNHARTDCRHLTTERLRFRCNAEKR